MNLEPPVVAPPKSPAASLTRTLTFFREETGHSLAVWGTLALAATLTMIAYRREMHPGEFGTLNTALGVITLLTLPLVAVHQGMIWYLAQKHPADQADRLGKIKEASVLVTETFAWGWGGLTVLLSLASPLLDLPRMSLILFILLNVFFSLSCIIGDAINRKAGQMSAWATLLIAASVARLFAGPTLAAYAPWAEAALAAMLVTGFITLVPILRQTSTETHVRLDAIRVAFDRELLLWLGATFSVFLSIFLFTGGDRIIAQSGFGSPSASHVGFLHSFVDWPAFDAYQTAGLIARSLLWALLPVLLLWYAVRSRIAKTTVGSMTWFWIYLGALIGGVILLAVCSGPLAWLFCGKDFAATAKFIPYLALAMLPLGLLQAFGIFSLASRRYEECFTLGGCSLVYALVLYLFGRHPEVMSAYMFGTGLASVMMVLCVGVVRWGRKQP